MLRLLTFLAALGLAVLPAAAGAADDRRAFAAVLEAVRAVPGWSASTEAPSPDADPATFQRLVIESTGGFKLTAQQVAAANVRPSPGGGASFGRLTLERVTVSYGATAVSLPRLDLKELALPPFAGWSPDPGRPGASTGALLTLLARVSFAEASAPELAAATGAPAPGIPPEAAGASPGDAGLRFRLANVTARNMRTGRLAALSIERIDGEEVEAVGQRATTRVRGVTISGASVATLAAVVDPAASEPARDWRTALDGLTIEALEQRGGPASPGVPEQVRFLARLHVRDVAVRRGETSVGELYDEIFAPAAQATGGATFIAGFPAALSWIRLGELTTGQGGVSGGPSTSAFRFDSLTIKDLSPEFLASAALEGASFSSGTGQMRLSRAIVEQVRWPSPEAVAAVAALDEEREAGAIDAATLERAADNVFATYPEIGRFSMEGLNIALGGADLLKLGQMSIGQTKEAETTTSRLTLANLVIAPALIALLPDGTAAMEHMGYRQLEFDGDGATFHDRASGACVNAATFTLADGGKLSLSFTLAGLTDAALREIAIPVLRGGEDEAAILEMADALDAVTLEGATLRYDDALLVRRLVDWWAQQEGMPVAQVAQNVADGVAETVHLAEPSLTEPARDAVRAFLLNPGSITLGLSPPQGVGLGQFLDIVIGAAETVPALGMTIEAGD